VDKGRLVAANFNPNYPPDGSTAVGQTINGTEQNDTLVGGFGNDMMYGLGGDDRLDGQAGNDVLDGGDGNDTLVGNFGNDRLLGGAGNDNLSDDQGSNVLEGGSGDDYLSARARGNQTLIGGSGNDNLNAGGDTVSMDGGEGNDSLNLQDSRNAVLLGGVGDDNLSGYLNPWNVNDLTGGDARQNSSIVMDGGDGNDNINPGGYGNEQGTQVIRLSGGTGNDRVNLQGYDPGYSGAFQAASLDGGEGDDVLSAQGVRQLSMTGGSGADTFVLTAGQYDTIKNAGTRRYQQLDGTYVDVAVQAVVITDFAAGAGNDVLDYSDMIRNRANNFDGSNPFATGHLKLVQSGADTQLQFKADGAAGTAVTVALLQNVDKGRLVAANFNPNYPPDGSSGDGQVIVGG